MQSIIRNIIFLLAVLVAASCSLQAQEAADSSDRAVREAPVFPDEGDGGDSVNVPPFISMQANRIDLNGADWNSLKEKFKHTDSTTVTIVHIGDSHIQADFATGRTRVLMQSRYGSAGRGLIIPFKLASTNEPRDYLLKSSGRWEATKLMKQSQDVPIGFTGIGIMPVTSSNDLTIATLAKTGRPESFDRFKIYHVGHFSIDSISHGGEILSFSAAYTDTVTTVCLPLPVCEVTLNFTSTGRTSIFGVVLSNGSDTGIMYHAIGNNGATYRSYNLLPEHARHIGDMNPDLIIVSLGANEAFGKMTEDEIYGDIAIFVGNLRKSHPGAEILLTTPMECQRSTRRRRKRKSRRIYVINARIKPVRDEILRYARENGVAVYDWYEVAGGERTSKLWIANGLMAKDRIHHSVEGYRLQGQLLFEAINDIVK